MTDKEIQIIYEPVWRVSLRDERHRFRRLWCVYDPDAGCIFYGKKKKYALQKYNKWKATKAQKE